MKIAIQKNKYGNDIFEGNEYIVDLDRRFEGHEAGCGQAAEHGGDHVNDLDEAPGAAYDSGPADQQP